MDAKSKLKDETPIEYIASVSEDKSFYSLVIRCQTGLTDEDYALALMAFANDILDGQFKFDNDCGASEILSQ